MSVKSRSKKAQQRSSCKVIRKRNSITAAAVVLLLVFSLLAVSPGAGWALQSSSSTAYAQTATVSQETTTASGLALSGTDILGGGQVSKQAATSEPETQCHSILLYDHKTGTVLFSKNADEQMTMASITKVMTCILVLENLDMDQEVTVTSDAVFRLGHNMELEEGEVLTVEQLVNTMMVYSANDAALALAIAVSGSVDDFVALMNEKAAELGMDDTNFLVPNGFTESYDHHTTCYDLQKLLNYALEVPGFKEIVGQSEYTVEPTNKHSEARTYESTNLLLYDTETEIWVDGQERTPKYEGVYGIKTGMMLSSMYCLTSGCERDGTDLICICLYGVDENDRFEDSIALYDWAFENYETRCLLEPGSETGRVAVKYGHQTHVQTECADGVYATALKDDPEDEYSYTVELYDDVEAPIKKGTVVGQITITKDGETIGTEDVQITKSVEKGGPWSAFYISDPVAYVILVLAALLILLCIVRRRQKKRS